MDKEIKFSSQFYEINNELKENVIIAEKMFEVFINLRDFLKKMPKDELGEKCVKSIMDLCEIEIDRHCQILGSYVFQAILLEGGLYNDGKKTPSAI